MTEAFPWDTAPRYLLRDRDESYGPAFRHRVRAMGITEVITAPRSPWQNPYVERLIGSIRRECLDHVIVLNERHLRRVLSSYCQYHHDSRTHLSLDKDCPWPRRVQLPSAGNIIAFPEVGGLHHRYERGGTLPVPALNRAKLNFEQGQQDTLSPFSKRHSPEKT
jgi:putative transposase